MKGPFSSLQAPCLVVLSVPARHVAQQPHHAQPPEPAGHVERRPGDKSKRRIEAPGAWREWRPGGSCEVGTLGVFWLFLWEAKGHNTFFGVHRYTCLFL